MEHLDIQALRLVANESTFRIDLDLGALAQGQQEALYLVTLHTATQGQDFNCFIGDPNPGQPGELRCSVTRSELVKGGPVTSETPYADEGVVSVDWQAATVSWEVPMEDLQENCPLGIEKVWATSTLVAGARNPNGGFLADFTLGESDRLEHLDPTNFAAPREASPGEDSQEANPSQAAPSPFVTVVLLLAFIAINRRAM